VQAVLLPVAEDVYAVAMDWVREVVTAPPLTPLVTAPEVVLGLFNLRGEVVPLLDTAMLLGLGAVGTVAFAVVLQSRSGLVGLAATGLPWRAELDGTVGPSELPGTAGSYRVDGLVAVLLDPPTLLESRQLRGAEQVLPVGPL
jgi:purine-binding chemotaxis protein CheW